MNEDRSRQRLGRGLASLIGGAGTARPVPGFASVAPDEPSVSADRMVPLSRITPNPNNPRKTFGDAELADLAASIAVHGIVQPLLVRPKPGEKGRYEIVAGERRFRAAKLAGLNEVPVVLREIGDRESIEIAIIENVQRADLNPIEEALGYELLIAEHGYTQADLADVLGKSRSHVANTLRLLKLPETVRGMVTRGELSAGHARTAVSAEDPERFAQQIVDGGLSVREAETLARREGAGKADAPVASAVDQNGRSNSARKPRPASSATKDEDTQALEQLLSGSLGMPVAITWTSTGGSLRIDYSDLSQLDELCRLLKARRDPQDGPRIRSL
ncbi:ParB/RepB/Spo0J family partition protein [Mangrovicella endophytica]|uniref:ParB/RepB/Spo0J family partition protein n=1 Tax=Mangrovicella endophytica TaxID=2066697 RepID=UPI000C9E4968|nr:ParB/RepB/Spo0J family partition protein [Mangrovicella endophytica]